MPPEPDNRRPDWDTYFMDIARVVARRSNCRRRRVGAVIVHGNRIISTGYNGTPRGVTNCLDGGCPRCAAEPASGTALGECICSHAEENAFHGTAVNGARMYCTTSPCLACARMIINAGITEVIYEEEYEFTEQTRALFHEAGVGFRRFRSAEGV